MMRLDTWVAEIEICYENRKHDQASTMELLILNAPESVWGPEITDLQSKAIACWLDGCLRIYLYSRYQDPEKAYQFLQLAYSKLQQVVCEPRSELILKDWCMKRLQHLAVLSLEFCNQQTHAAWQTKSHQLIEAHVNFMTAHSWNEPQNNDQGHRSLH